MWHMFNLMMSNRPQCSMRSTSFNVEGSGSTTSLDEEVKVDTSGAEASINLPLPLFETQSSSTDGQTDDLSSLSIAVIGATGVLARTKIFLALFALYYSGQLPEKFGIFGYSRKNLTEEDLRAMIAPTLSCHIDHHENCEEKMDAFLKRTFYLNGGYDNREGCQSSILSWKKLRPKPRGGWNRLIIEKPFGLGSFSSHQLTSLLLSNFEEKQLYRIDHLLGRNTIENLAVLRHADLSKVAKVSVNLCRLQEMLYTVTSSRQWPCLLWSPLSPLMVKMFVKRRVEIRIQFRRVPGNLYHKDGGHTQNLATNELILPDEAILIPGLSMSLEASELNLIYKDKYNVDVILSELDNNNVTLEHYNFGSKGPDKAGNLWAKHGVKWLDD
ncbi:hypothetical protein K7X08_036483 [Anisodus acutangulus]|uniref:Glucose-6-phosphate dehydrogenase NAD-binding domain-containing protein n=1 Tax=Anisodus acutangulus TaxID=402998 RepID=A0A9Q1QWX1_9SOLA|nr:hypothetical protein K7X08_036483 [Anisodus acutangulus]